MVDWHGKRFFVVHIPKTGGTSLFDWFIHIFGQTQCCEHIESLVLPQPTPATVDHLRRFNVVSGHVPYDYQRFIDPGARTVTIMREPEAQFFSHVNHIRTEVIGPGPLRAIQDMLAVSTGHFLDNATPEQLEFFESPQSRSIFSGGSNWRALSIEQRVDWLRQNYAAVLTTETMDAELSALRPQPAFPPPAQSDGKLVHLFDPARGRRPSAAVAPPPRLNVKHYTPDALTLAQTQVLRNLVRQDALLHQALTRHTLAALPCAATGDTRPSLAIA